jgi:hypothetical protein
MSLIFLNLLIIIFKFKIFNFNKINLFINFILLNIKKKILAYILFFLFILLLNLLSINKFKI